MRMQRSAVIGIAAVLVMAALTRAVAAEPGGGPTAMRIAIWTEAMLIGWRASAMAFNSD